eukprot:g1489.t1
MRRASLLTALVAGHVGFLLHQESLTVVEAAAPMQVDDLHRETSSAPMPKTNKPLALPKNFRGSKKSKPVAFPWPCENFGDVEFFPAEFENETLTERCFYQGDVEVKWESRQLSGEAGAGDAPLKIVEIKKRKGRGKFYQVVPGTKKNEPGATYEGNFEDNKFDGAGVLTLATGRVIRANWVAGALRNSDPKTRCSSDYGELELEDSHWTRLHRLSKRFNRTLHGVVHDERLVGGWNKLQIKGAIVHTFSGGRLCEAFLKDRHMESGHPDVARIVDREEDDAEEMKKWLSSRTEAEMSSARGSADHGIGEDLRAGALVDEGDSRAAPASIVADHYDYEFDSLPQLGTAFVDVGRRTLHRLNLFVDTSPAPASAPPGGRAAAAEAGEELPLGGDLEEEDEDEDFSASSPPPVGTLTTSFRFTPIERGFGSDRTYVAENREIVVEQIVSRFWSGPFLVDCEAAARRALGLDDEADSGAGPPTVADFYIAKVTSLGDAEDRIRSAASPSISGGDSTWLEGRPVSIMQEPVERYSVYTGPLNSRLLADTATKMARHCVRYHGHDGAGGLLDKRRFGDEFFMMGGEKSPDGKPFLAATQEDWAALPNEFQVGGEPQIAVDAAAINETIAQVLGRFDLQLAQPRPNPSTKFEPLAGCRLPAKKWTLLDWNKYITAANQRRPDLAIRAKLSSSRYEGGGGRDDKILRVMKQVVHYEGEWRAGYRHGLIRLNVVYVIPKSEAEVGAARTGESKDAKVVVGTGGRMQWGAVDNYDVWTQFLANNVDERSEEGGAATDVEPASNTATAAAKLLDERIARAIREGKAGAEVSIRLADALRYPRLFEEAVDRSPKSVKEQLDKSAQQYEDFERLLQYDSLSEEERVRSRAKEVEGGHLQGADPEAEERWKRMLAWYNSAQLWPSPAARVHMLPHLRIALPGFVRRAQGWWRRNDFRIGQRDEDQGTQTRGTVEEVVVEVEVDDQMGKKKVKREVKRRNHLVLGSYLLLHVNRGDFIKAKERVYGGSGAGGYSVYPNDQMLFLKGRLLVEQDRFRAIGDQRPVAVESLRWPVYNFMHSTQREGWSGKMFPMEHQEFPLVAHGMGDLAETQRQQREWKVTRDTLWRKNFKRRAAPAFAVFRAGQMDDKTHLYLVSDRFYARPVVDDAEPYGALQGRGPLQLREVGDALSIEDARALEAEFMEHHDQGTTGTCYAYAVANLLQMYRMLYHRFGVVRQWPRNPEVSWEADFQRLETRRLATMLQSSEVKGVVKAPHLWQTPGRGHQFPSLEAELPPVNYNEQSWIGAPWDFHQVHTQLQQHPPQPLHPAWAGFNTPPVWGAAGGVHGVYGGQNLGLHLAPQRRVTPTPMPEAVTRQALIDGGYIEEALLRAVGGAVALRTEQEVITWLETKGPVAAHYRVKPQAAAPTQGQLPYPQRPAAVEHGFHAMVVIGYKRTEVGKPVSWVLKNSWDHMRILATDDPKFLDTFYTGPPEKSDTDQVVSSSSAGEEDAHAHAALLQLREKKELESSYEPAFWAPRYLPPQQYSNTEQHEETLAHRFEAQDQWDRLLESPLPEHLRGEGAGPGAIYRI